MKNKRLKRNTPKQLHFLKMQKMILSFAKDTPEGAAALKDLVP
jgi:hypothetical protein